MPNFPPPDPVPSVQLALRARLEALLSGDGLAAAYEHHDRFWESDDGGQAMFAWATIVTPRKGDGRIEVVYDMLDNIVWVDADLPRRRWLSLNRGSWRQWDDLADASRVADEVAACVAQHLERTVGAAI